MLFDNGIDETKAETFSCRFDPVNDYQWMLTVCQNKEQADLAVRVSIYDDDLLRRDFPKAPPIAADLIELAIVVYAVDRAIQPDRKAHCSVHVSVPVRSPERLRQPMIRQQLADILHWYTGYEWSFEFEKRTVPQRDTEKPRLFDWRDQNNRVDVALWSGGLDCLAGLFNRAVEDENRRFILCGTGNNTRIHGLQKKIIGQLPHQLASRIKLSQVRYGIEIQAGRLPNEPRLRSRGFTFMMIGAICAYLEGQDALQVYENGIGAINLRFRESEIGLNHAHSVHPLSLMLIGQWLSQVLEQPLRIDNPFLFWTKAQMCQVLLDVDGLAVAFETQTCDRMHRKKGVQVQQCGRCSSCILRRQAFAALGLQDQTPYVYDTADWLYGSVTFQEIEKGNHIPAVLHQVDHFHRYLQATNPWQSLVSRYDTLAAYVVDRTASYTGLTPDAMRDRLLRLFQQYVHEWHWLRN